MKYTRIRNYLALFLIAVIVLFSILFSEFSSSEYGAIKKYPFGTKGTIVYEQLHDREKVIIVEGDNSHSVYVVKSYNNILHRVIDVNQLVQSDPAAPLLRTWGGSRNNNNMFDTLIAVQALDYAIVKVIVSNEQHQEEYSDNIGDIIANSTFFEVLTLKDGFATFYDELESSLVGSYIFRGLNAKGEIIAVLR